MDQMVDISWKLSEDDQDEDKNEDDENVQDDDDDAKSGDDVLKSQDDQDDDDETRLLKALEDQLLGIQSNNNILLKHYSSIPGIMTKEEVHPLPVWFQQPKRLPSPNRAWNKSVPADHESVQPWLSIWKERLRPREVQHLSDERNMQELWTKNCKDLFVKKSTKSHRKIGLINPKAAISSDLRKPLQLVTNFSVTKTKAADYGHIKWIEDLVPNSMWSQVIVNYDKFALLGESHIRARSEDNSKHFATMGIHNEDGICLSNINKHMVGYGSTVDPHGFEGYLKMVVEVPDSSRLTIDPLHMSYPIDKLKDFHERAFTASSTIPSIYIQQFWDTIRFDKDKGYSCQLDEQRFYLTKATLRDALQLPSAY
ncbi:hypothetical protein Tco_0290165 [Tanacetum coccineum]